MTDAAGYVLAALITAVSIVVVAVVQIRANGRLAGRVTELHDEVRTNHGVRQGQRIEDLGEDVAFIRRTMVTKLEMQEHTEQDHAFQARVEPFLTQP
jgi:hypothetical protein